MEDKINQMWQAFIQQNDRPNYDEFIRKVSNEFSCSLLEAQEMTSHLLLTE